MGVGSSVDMAVELIVIAAIVPLGLVAIAGANLTGVSAAVSTIFTVVMPILAMVGIVKGWWGRKA